MIARDFISNTLTTLSPNDSAILALSVMDEYKLSHLPVVENGHYLGLISEVSLLSNHPNDLLIHDLRSSFLAISIGSENNLYDILTSFRAQKIGALPVVDSENQYLGVIHSHSFLDQLSSILGANEPGGVIILEINIKDYSPSEIAQIVESNDVKIINLFFTSIPESTRAEVTMKLNRLDIDAVVQAFNRYNYFVKATYSESPNTDDLLERFQSFMKYLNV